MEHVNQQLVTATGLTAGYANKKLWSNADFTINRGEFVGLLGPNGAGKTTMFRILLGLMQPLHGNVHILGKTPHRGNPRIGYVPQRRLIDSDMHVAVIELVQLGIRGAQWGFSTSGQAKDERNKAYEALRLVDAEALAYRSLGELSGGELQRVFLAQALVGKPDLLLLDEPLANLDIRRETELVSVINAIVRTKNIAVLLIAHDINPLLPVVDRIIYVVNGRVASGTASEIVTNETLSMLYGAPVEVLRDSRGRVAVLGTEVVEHHE